ncbi:uncharacterized protein [Nicotiana tomentosiformis]|uniref:uncharacterized protein n=1 Tax=Nicotiana tomentosiformis TaxID=4098 RepID=UPI00388C7D6B
MGLSTGSLLSSVDEQPTPSTALAVTTSHPSTPSASSPSSPTLPPVTATSSPLSTSIQEEDSLALENDWEKIQALSGEFLLNNAMHNAAAANLLSSEGLQRLIREKEELTSKRDQIIARLSEFEAKVSEAVVLETRLQQSKREVETLIQEIAPMRDQFEEARAKWDEVHSVILAASGRESASAERLNNLEAALNSKTEELAAPEVKYAQLEENYKINIEHNRLFISIFHDLDVSLWSIRYARENRFAEVDQLKEKLKHRAAFLIVEKAYVMYNIRRKTLEEAKAGVIDFDAKIAKTRELESAAKRGLPARPDASGSSGSGSKSSGLKRNQKSLLSYPHIIPSQYSNAKNANLNT